MSLLRQCMATLLTESAHDALAVLDKNSQAARDLSALDVETALKEDVEKICGAISFGEAGKVISLAAQLKARVGDRQRVKDQIKKIASDVIERIERSSGNLKIPASCRDMLFKL